VRDANGKKMSKSEGNVIDPLDVINGISLDKLLQTASDFPFKTDKKKAQVLKNIEKDFPEGIPAAGADGLRFTLAALSAQGRDVKLSIPRTAGYRKFLNKIWNAAVNYVEYAKITDAPDVHTVARAELSLADRWILSR